ncbi:hypothetical protein DAEQUDRAFT_63298 [Daedalea quercina L-15889]|uniref:Secreted protein n=1 Tax=Daedalea quercina L-15889 TaxID=1314783 RepID=A0A165SMR1_9APHY|nr:hypothetical protein DAEQUDRAFT_63298 [Daedalea quercina L-15889]
MLSFCIWSASSVFATATQRRQDWGVFCLATSPCPAVILRYGPVCCLINRGVHDSSTTCCQPLWSVTCCVHGIQYKDRIEYFLFRKNQAAYVDASRKF